MAKVRTDFVTNSSSSSFILGFKDHDDLHNFQNTFPEWLSEKVIQDVVADVMEGMTTYDHAVEEYQDDIYLYDLEFNGKDYWDMTKEERKSEEYLKFKQQKKDQISESFINKAKECEFISIVDYEDHSQTGSILEHEIMPYHENTLARLSHH